LKIKKEGGVKRGFLLAEKGDTGETFLLAGGNISFWGSWGFLVS